MKKTTLFSVSMLIAGLAVVSPVSAMYVEQKQDQSQSSSANAGASVTVTNGSGSASANSSASTSQSQNQSQKVDAGRAGRTYAHGTRVVRGAWISGNHDGQVTLSWGQRGGTCHIRYSENADRGYRYATATGCDNGGITIGGLTPGVTYRFQMKQDNGGWLRAVVVKAQ